MTSDNCRVLVCQGDISKLATMPSEALDNANPVLHSVLAGRQATEADWDDTVTDPFDTREIFDLIRWELDHVHVMSPVLTERLMTLNIPSPWSSFTWSRKSRSR